MIIGIDPHKASHTATVVDPATARVREMSRGGRRKNDVIVASAGLASTQTPVSHDESDP